MFVSQAFKDYCMYLADLFVIPLWRDKLVATDGLVSSRSVDQWVRGDLSGKPNEALRESLDDDTNPLEYFSLIGKSDPNINGPPMCTQATDVHNEFSACVRVVKDNKVQYQRGIHTMYTGKGDLNKLGQYKAFAGDEVIKGLFPGDIPVDGGARSVMSEPYKPLVEGKP